jgi:Kef-type K+ transport system membrane component KefB
MFENVWFVAAAWMALALVASLISIWTGISVALIEILVGVVAGNFLHLQANTDWINFLALLGSGVLTFLAGAEIDPESLKANLRASLLIGIISFAIPFLLVWLFAQFVLGWPLPQAQIAGIALSTTSVAVVYAVMIEGGLSDTSLGKMILAACFITDFGTVLALGGLFTNFNVWLLVFVVVMSVMLWFMPAWTRFIIVRLGAKRVSEPEVKFIFLSSSSWADSRQQRGVRQCCLHIWSVSLWPEFSCATRPLSIVCGASLLQCLPRSISSEPVFLFLFLRFGQGWQLLQRCCF